MKKLLKITESQFKKIVETLHNQTETIQEQGPMGASYPLAPAVGAQNPNLLSGKKITVPNPGEKDEIYFSGPNNMGGKRPEDFDAFIKKSKLDCVRGSNSEFGKDTQLGLYVKFYVSDDKKQYVIIYSNARANAVINDNTGKSINKMVTARCYTTPPLKNAVINLYEGNTLMYTFDPKNPIKKANVTKPQAKTEQDLRTGKGFVYYGMSGEIVGKIQQMLKDLTYNVEVNNKFDKATYNAVIEYQKLAQLKVDGIVGPKTYQSLVDYHKIYLRTKGAGEGPKTPETQPLQAQTTGFTATEKLAAPTTPEQVKAAEQERYFKDPGRQLFVDNINKSLNYRNPNRRVLLWKGKNLNQQDLDNLNNYLASNGYAFTLNKDKGDAGAKYKWVFNR